jgi:hypothetical protein
MIDAPVREAIRTGSSPPFPDHHVSDRTGKAAKRRVEGIRYGTTEVYWTRMSLAFPPDAGLGTLPQTFKIWLWREASAYNPRG